MQFLESILLLAALAAWGSGAGPSGGPAEAASGSERIEADPAPRADAEAPASDWIVEEADNVCGLTDPRQITNPAEVDYDELLAATPEMKEMKRKGIGKDTPEGQVLYNKAVDRIRNAAARVMKDKGYDSVWKKIRHRKGKKVPSITDAVKDALDK